MLDAVIASLALALLAPVFAIVSIAIKLRNDGPVFYRQARVGKHGCEFQLLKFRSMRVGADARGAGVTVHGDDRITAIGRTLRRWKLDELPQLVNVLRGEMSLVGPRPELPRFVATYQPWMTAVLDYSPGISDVASLAFMDEEEILAAAEDPQRVYVSHILPEKVAISLRYAERSSVVSDLGVLFKTVGTLLSSRLSRYPLPAGDRGIGSASRPKGDVCTAVDLIAPATTLVPEAARLSEREVVSQRHPVAR